MSYIKGGKTLNADQRNLEMDILKGLGIILVVMGHYYLPFPWFNPYSFHMPLFFFISGYFYNARYENDVLLLARKRATSLLLPYFWYSVILGICALTIHWKNHAILFYSDSSPFTLYNFFVMPFISSHHNALFLTGWFLTQLFIVNIFFVVFYKLLKLITKNMYIHLVVFLFMAYLGTYLGSIGFNGFAPGYKLIISRTLFATAFFFIGFFCNWLLNEKKLNIYKTHYLALMFAVQIYILTNIRDTHFYMVWSDFLGHTITPMIVSVNGIYLYLFIAHALSKVLTEKDILVKLGRNSLHILSLHLTIFFLLNVIWIKYKGLDITVLKDVYFRENQKYWLVYVSAGLLIPAYVMPYVIGIAQKIYRPLLARAPMLNKQVQATKR